MKWNEMNSPANDGFSWGCELLTSELLIVDIKYGIEFVFMALNLIVNV